MFVAARPGLFRWLTRLGHVMLLVGLATLLSSAVSAQEILRGKLKSLDLEKREAVVTIDEKDRTFVLSDQTQVLDASGDTLAEKLKDFKAGVDLFVRPETRDGREVLLGMKLAGSAGVKGGTNRGAAQGDVRQGVLKQLDIEKRTATITAEGKDLAVIITAQTQIRSGGGNTQAEQLATLKLGEDIRFVAQAQGDSHVLVGIMSLRGAPQNAPRRPELVKVDSSAFKPINDLATGEYNGFMGGFYPRGENTRPAKHEADGVKLAQQIKPLDDQGAPADNGRIVLLSLGMSNTSQASQGFSAALREFNQLNPRVLFVNGAQGGMTAAVIQNTDPPRGQQFWNTVDDRLREAGATRAQVQAVWIKQADAGPSEGFPGYARKLQAELAAIVRLVHDRFPNVKLAYLSSRTYGGYATTGLNPEPYAYESGFSVKWLIEQQIDGESALNYDPAKGAVKAPWLSWGAYLWANGAKPRSDGFSYEQADFANDGTHQSSSGQRKVGEQLLKFFQTDSTTRPWFIRP